MAVASHSARTTFQSCRRRFFFEREMRLEPKVQGAGRRMGKAFADALEHEDPARVDEMYEPLVDELVRASAPYEEVDRLILEGGKVRVLVEHHLDEYAARLATFNEIEFNSPTLGRGVLDGIIEEFPNGRDAACPVHGAGRSAGGRLLADGRTVERSGVRAADGGEAQGAGASAVMGALPGTDPRGDGHGPSVPRPQLREPGTPGAGDAAGESVARQGSGGRERSEDGMPARPSIHAGEHAPHEDGPGLSRVQSDRGAHGPAAGAPAADALQARASDGGRERPDARGKATLSSLRQRAEICTCVVRYVGVENKCLSKAFWRRADEQRLHIDLQVTAYFCAAREAGVPLDRMLYRTTFKPGIDRRMSRNPETIDQYLERLAADIRERPDYYEAEYELYRSEQDMDEFLAEVDEIDSEIKRSRKRGAWARSTERCADYGGCPFLSLCRGVPDAIEAYNVKPAPIPQRAQRVLDTLAESVSEAFNPTEGTRIPELVGQTGLAPAAVTYELRRLIDLELVERVSRGCYATTQSGRDRADGAL